jgi:pimeloyl-ACP methyl ester carboxylesterase
MPTTDARAVAPFQQGRFDDLPDEPRIPHAYASMKAETVFVDSRHFGRAGVHVRTLGERSSPPLVLVHGLMTTSYSFRYVVAPLSKRWRVIVPDLVGAGRSDKPDVSYGPIELARFVGELVDTLGVRGAYVVGNSLGGYLSMQLALDDPSSMRGLLNIHSPAFPDARLHALHHALRVPGAKALLDAMIRRSPERWAHKNVHYRDESLKSREEAREYGAPLSTPEGRRAFARYLGQTLAPAELARFVERIARAPFPVPLRLVYAREDPMVPPSVGPRLAELVPGVRLVRLERSSHFAQVDTPERLVAEIEAFGNELESSAVSAQA